MTSVEAQLETARENLLDMTLRNKLLNFKEYKRSTAEVVDEVPSQVYEHLVIDDNSMTFLPSEDHPDNEDLEVIPEDDALEVREEDTYVCMLCDDQESSFGSEDGIFDHLEVEHGTTVQSDRFDRSPQDIENLWDLPELTQLDEDRHTDRRLQTPHSESDLQKRLYNISNRAQALIEDAGYNALHLAIGFLEWTEADAHEDPNRAPLILIPVSLERQSAQSRFKIEWNQEEVAGNLSLELKLSEQGYELPEFDQTNDRDDIRGYLEEVGDSIEEWEDWSVAPDIHLGFFDFTKFIMYQDLNPEAWEEGNSPADHHLLQALLDPDTSTDEPDPFDENDIDDELDPIDVHHVKDADPSQIAAIEDVKRGRNLVIEGPPGTGKSQSIVNLIGELVAEDKTVLFVSEKLAALDVVKERLDSVGVGDFCLELHSDKASKSDFLDELERIVKLDSYDPDIPRQTFDQLTQRRDELNAYADALGTPMGELEYTPFDLYGLREEVRQHFREKDRTLPRVEIDAPLEIEPAEDQAARSALEQLAARADVVQPVPQHPWYGCSPGDVLPQDRRDVERHLETTRASLDDLEAAISRLERECAVTPDPTIAGITQGIEAAEVLTESEPVDAEVLQNSAWNQKPPEAEDLIGLVDRATELGADVGERTEPSHVDPDVSTLLTEYRDLHDSITRFIRPRWYSLGSHLSGLYDGERPDDSDQIIQDLEHLIELQEVERDIEKRDARGRELFGSLWQGSRSDPDRLRNFSEWVVDFRRHLLDEVYQDESVEMVTRGVGESQLDQTISETTQELEAVEQQLEALVDMLGMDAAIVFGAPIAETSLESIDDQLDLYQSEIGRLERWSRFDGTRAEVRETPAAPIVDRVDEGDLFSEDILPCYEGNLADAFLSEAFAERDVLKRFDGEVFEDRIESFRELDRRSLDLNKKRVLSHLVDRSPELMEGASKSSPAGTLFHEFGKERRHKPIRVLLQDAGGLIQQMKPCFMMSPLSVAKYLEPDGIDFDVVIFDEASQVKPEDALGAILRGQQVVMLGDTKQLPPTSFFDQIVDQRDSEDEWGFNIQDVESILDLCRSTFPMKRLKWHYRSRHESLIAVSNQEFYNNDLLIYPSPVQDADELGLRLNHLPDTVYDRGASSVNREEARAVAEAAVEHYRDNPTKSLGVGTFSQPQQKAIQEEIELLRKENPDIDEYFARGREENFFVKNLERIQGDERDVIFISVGYGFDQHGKFSHNFGPLNNRGGWRRLNVLITRAREQCVVFANFTADALDASKISNRGLASLKVFMKYAETRNLETQTGVGEDPDSPFERSVIRFLEDKGYQVHPQVGSAGFRIDLAIPDPDNPGRYVLGIECDGASYHSSPVARARDRQRQSVLEDRGWEIYRVWSTDWYREQERTKERLVAAVEDALDRGAPGVTSDGTDAETDASTMSDETPALEDLQSDGAGISVEDIGEEYQSATGIPYSRLGDYEIASTKRAVEHIVTEEGPIHRELVAKRVVGRSDVSRRGKKVNRTIRQAIAHAEKSGPIEMRGEFLYPESLNDVPVRRRTDDEADIEWIPDREIERAVLEILERQYETPVDDLTKQVAKVLGFKRTGSRISDRVKSIIDDMVNQGHLEKSGQRVSTIDS